MERSDDQVEGIWIFRNIYEEVMEPEFGVVDKVPNVKDLDARLSLDFFF